MLRGISDTIIVDKATETARTAVGSCVKYTAARGAINCNTGKSTFSEHQAESRTCTDPGNERHQQETDQHPARSKSNLFGISWQQKATPSKEAAATAASTPCELGDIGCSALPSVWARFQSQSQHFLTSSTRSASSDRSFARCSRGSKKKRKKKKKRQDNFSSPPVEFIEIEKLDFGEEEDDDLSVTSAITTYMGRTFSFSGESNANTNAPIEQQQQREKDDECTYANQSILLHDLILSHEYAAVSKLLDTDEGKEMAQIAHSSGNLPLHMLCGYDHDCWKRMENIHNTKNGGKKRRESEGEQSEGFKEFKRRAMKISRPSVRLLFKLLNAYPDAVRVRGSGQRLPLHHATRLHFPAEFVSALVDVYPEGLHALDESNTAPMYFIRQHSDYSFPLSGVATNKKGTNMNIRHAKTSSLLQLKEQEVGSDENQASKYESSYHCPRN